MSINIDLKEIERRANHAAYQDGLNEIILGAFLFFYGGMLTTRAISFLPLMLLVVFFAKPAVEKIKARYIYPRTGYVKLPPEPESTGRGIGIAAIVMVIVLLGLMGLSILTKGTDQGLIFFLTYIVPPISGVLMAIGPVWMGQKYGLIRGYIWAALFVISGIAMPIFNIETGYEAVGLMCTLVGLVILATSTIIFMRFIRRHEPQTIEFGEISDAS
jgi:hypothetical protein